MIITIKLAICLFLIALVAYYSFQQLAVTSKIQLFGNLVTHIKTNEKVVALTYDDGPNPPYTEQTLDVLGRFQIKATFFVVGKKIAKYPETVRQVISLGHELGNHSFSHKRMIFKNLSFLRSEIEQTDRLLYQLGVCSEIHFRSPFGLKRIRLPWTLAQMGKKNILWNIDTKDYAASDPESIVKQVMNQIQPGLIILMHDGGLDRTVTIAATEILISKLQKQGYQFKTVSELISLKA
jgi:peptidoglycan/xylan/chitin deacetylase (PgdA/CDA1 family)